MVTTTETRTERARTERGVSLARGPALIVGTILLAVGLYALYREHTFPPFSNFPNGNAPVEGKVFHIFGANGWTGMLTAVGGGLRHSLVVEHQLRPLFGFFEACTVSTAIYASSVEIVPGEPLAPMTAARIANAVEQFASLLGGRQAAAA